MQTNPRAGVTAGGQCGINAPDPEIDALITKYIETVDDKAREAIGVQIGKLFYERAYWVFLHEPVTIFATSNKWNWEPTKFAGTSAYEFREIKRA